MTKILTPEAEAELADFRSKYSWRGNCSCHLSAPCGSCSHPGNPTNQAEDETAWEDATQSDVQAAAGGLSQTPLEY